VSSFSPKIIEGIFFDRDFEYAQVYAIGLQKHAAELPSPKIDVVDTPELRMFHEKVWEKAKKEFNSETLLPSWSCISIYHRKQKPPQIYDSACTYAITLPIYQIEPWELMVEGVPVSLVENQAIFYMGNEAALERFEFPNPENNFVVEASFFFVEPDHWWFTEGESYLYDVIRAPKQ
jgi:hypothetical protein